MVGLANRVHVFGPLMEKIIESWEKRKMQSTVAVTMAIFFPEIYRKSFLTHKDRDTLHTRYTLWSTVGWDSVQ